MVDRPPVESSAIETAVSLAQGFWCVRPDEWAELDGTTPEKWQQCVEVVCSEHGIPVEFVRYAEDQLTAAINPERPPTDEQLQGAVSQMLKLRDMRR